MGRTAFLFPGQGAQKAGMGRDFHAAFPVARETFAAAGAALGWDVAAKCFDGPQAELDRTAVSQPAILTVGAAILRVVEQEAPGLWRSCEAVAGLSLGEYTALAAADALDFADAVRLIQLRGRYMEEACAERRGAMTSVLGLDGEAVKQLCAAHGEGAVWAANFNSPGQVVISGDAEKIKRVAEACVAAGAKRAVPLAVAGAFHTPLMQSAADKLRPELARAPFRPAARPVVANVNAAYVTAPEAVRSGLASQVTSAVLWQQSMERLLADGYTRFVEVGPGNVLSGRLRRIGREAEAISIADVAALEKVRTL